MITERGQRYVERVRERLAGFESGEVSLYRLIADLEALFGLLLDEAGPDLVGNLEAECNRLEFVNAAAIQDSRLLNDHERTEVADAIEQLRRVVEPY